MSQRYGNASSGRSWNEFQWEQELRREDRRICCYFRELPLCQDLPGEEEMIFDVMQSRPGLIPAGAAPGHWRMWDAPLLAREPEEEDGTFPRRKPGDEWIERLDRMLADWNAIAALELKSSIVEESLAVSCAFGKLIVRLSDFIDTDAAVLRPLKLCLAKRCLRDLNELCNMLFAIGELQRSVQQKTADMAARLQQTREYLTDRIAEIRKSDER